MAEKRGCGGCLFRSLVLFVLSVVGLSVFVARFGTTTQPANGPQQLKPETESSDRKFISGLAAVDIHGNLTDRGFELKTHLGQKQCDWTCTRMLPYGILTCTAYGASPRQLTSVEAIASAPLIHADSIRTDAIEFLSFIATATYEGATPDDAAAWVQKNIGKEAVKDFGAVRFELHSETESEFVLWLTPTPDP